MVTLEKNSNNLMRAIHDIVTDFQVFIGSRVLETLESGILWYS